jgi:hypothetical protein
MKKKGFMPTEVLIWALIIFATAVVVFIAIGVFSKAGFSFADNFKNFFNFKA